MNPAEKCLVANYEVGPNCTVHIFGPGPDKINWRFNEANKEIVELYVQALALTQAGQAKRKNVFVHIPDCSTFNAHLAYPVEFGKTTSSGKFHLQHGCLAAGTEAYSGNAVAINTADCRTVIACHQGYGRTIGCHAGLGEIIDLRKLEPGVPGPSRSDGSVLQTLVNRMSTDRCSNSNSAELTHVKFLVTCGIEAKHFTYPPDHQIYGAKNRALLAQLHKCYGQQMDPPGEKGAINLNQLIKAQLMEYGVKENQIQSDELFTYGNPRLWSHRRWMNEGQNGPDGRNLILIVNR